MKIFCKKNDLLIFSRSVFSALDLLLLIAAIVTVIVVLNKKKKNIKE